MTNFHDFLLALFERILTTNNATAAAYYAGENDYHLLIPNILTVALPVAVLVCLYYTVKAVLKSISRS